MRLTYMFRRQPCTVIDVNFLDRKVVIQQMIFCIVPSA